MAAIDSRELGHRIQESRTRRGMSQDGLASQVGIERSAVSKIESGARKVSALELAHIAEALGVRMAHFFKEPTPALVSHRSSQGLDTVDSRIDEHLAEIAEDVELTQRLGALSLASPGDPWAHPHSRADAEAMARRAREGLGVGQSEPLVGLARRFAHLGLLVFSRDMGNDVADAGTLLLRRGGVTLVNSANKIGRRRLAAAHELGHYLVGDQYTVDYRVSLASESSIESRLDDFARALLLPGPAVEVQWKHVDGNEGHRAAAVILASTFRVDMSTLARRLLDLDLIDSSTAGLIRNTVTTAADMIEFDLHVAADELAGTTQAGPYQKAVIQLVRESQISTERAYDLLWGTVEEEELPAPRQRDAHEIWSFTS